MIYAKAKEENKNFYEVLDFYLGMIRRLHIKTKKYLADMKASCNPIAFCEGGFYKGFLKPTDKIEPLLDYATFSIGVTALNELTQLHQNTSIKEDNSFALDVVKYINNKKDEFKAEDNMLYAIYG